MGRGRPAHQPTDKSRQQVIKLASYGLTNDQISKVFGICEATLKVHYQAELSLGRPLGISKVADTAYQLATSGKVPAMTMFWLKCRAGWREVQDPPGEANANMRDLINAIKGKEPEQPEPKAPKEKEPEPESAADLDAPAPKKRGRPKKNPAV